MQLCRYDVARVVDPLVSAVVQVAGSSPEKNFALLCSALTTSGLDTCENRHDEGAIQIDAEYGVESKMDGRSADDDG